MAGKIFIADIHDRDRVSGTFLVQQKQVPLNKNAKPYIALVLMDRTGTMEARVWDNVEKYAPLFETGDFIDLQGVAGAYLGKIQVKVDSLKKIDATSINPDEFLPATPRDRGEMLQSVRELAQTLHHSAYRDLILGCLNDEEFRRCFSRAPAAKTIHHAYLGGLLEHTLCVMQLADRVASQYPTLDRDLLIAGAFFHDIGKIHELGFQRSFEYSDQGRLVGHIVMGAMMLTEWAKSYPGLSQPDLTKLVHLILSHHGSYEFGSPKRPKFLEALVLNYLDEMDSKVQAMQEVFLREKGQKWSSFQKLFDRYLYIDGGSEKDLDPACQNLDSEPFKMPYYAQSPLTQRPSEQLSRETSNKSSILQKPGEPLDLFQDRPKQKQEP